MISNLKTSPSSSPMSTSTTPREESWFGGSLAASGTEIFSCSNRPESRYGGGNCYKAPSSGNSGFTFMKKTHHPYGYPVTATTYENDLVIGVPWPSRIAKYTGTRFIEMR